ncbi:hypothetical protein QQP08_009896 [Theobroma cacao]|nr:hypothetical protein QQP08_009896 [Theobroma cacao]
MLESASNVALTYISEGKKVTFGRMIMNRPLQPFYRKTGICALSIPELENAAGMESYPPFTVVSVNQKWKKEEASSHKVH